MKTFEKIMALVLVAVMMMAMSVVAFAADDTVTITINRDDTYAGADNAAGRAYTWYKIFSATYDTNISSNASGYGTDGTATVDAGGTEGISYTATAAVAAKLGTWVAAVGTPGEEGYVAAHWEKAEGNLWFTLTPIADPENENYVVSWDNENTDAATLQAAAAWLIANEAYEKSGTMTFNGDADDPAWTAEVEKGYYVIASDVGDNLIAATTDIEIDEKNDYPSLDKTQADEDADAQSNDEVSVAIGDVITYEVKVTIPLTAAVGDTIQVWDIPSAGLDYNDDVTVSRNTGNATIADGTLGTNEIWHKVITVVAGSQGKDVVFTFTCTVTEDALEDTDRENTAQLKYGNNYESLPDSVSYTTWFSGIHKINDDDEGLEGVKFDLFEDGKPFNVKPVTQTTGEGDNAVTTVLYYIPDSSEGGSNEVVTDADGYIYIRGLDNDKTYTLTETETLPGYNMLDEDVTLVLVEDTCEVVTDDDGAVVIDENGKPVKEYSFDEYDPDDYQNVLNKQGTLLPSTGGIGTTIFYVVGVLLLIGAAIILIVKNRSGRDA